MWETQQTGKKEHFFIAKSLFAFARIPCSSRSAGAHAVQAPALHVRRVCCGELHFFYCLTFKQQAPCL
jgi:hypothetical protein